MSALSNIIDIFGTPVPGIPNPLRTSATLEIMVTEKDLGDTEMYQWHEDARILVLNTRIETYPNRLHAIIMWHMQQALEMMGEKISIEALQNASFFVTSPLVLNSLVVGLQQSDIDNVYAILAPGSAKKRGTPPRLAY